MSRIATRRGFLQQAAGSGLGFWVFGGIAAAASKAPGDKLNFASIGVGGKGSSDTDHAGQLGNVVALCDIDDHSLGKKAASFPRARKFHDFRVMLEEMDGHIDAVTVSTPDHTHAAAAMMALKMGKHVYCQKPLTHSIYEARLLRETAARQKLATQMGNQGTASDGFRRAVDIVRSGVIGHVRDVHVWTDRPIWPQAPDIVARPAQTQPIPPHVHWDLWLGPAPQRPYHDGTYHDFKWRGWWDFGTGALGDMGCHTVNLAFMALQLTYPMSVTAESGELNPETYPGWAVVHYKFPARSSLPAVRLTWYEGKHHGQRVLPPAELAGVKELSASGSLLVGDRGTLYSPSDYGDVYRLLPEKQFQDDKIQSPGLALNGLGDLGMKIEWIKAIRGGPPALSSFDYAGLLTETILLGNVAIRARAPLEWDGPGMRITNHPEMNRLLRREYRAGWKL